MEFTSARIGVSNGVPRLIGVSGPITEAADRLDQTIKLVEGMDQLATRIHQTAREHGFWDHEDVYADGHPDSTAMPNPSLVPEKLALIHSEVSEVLEAYRLFGKVNAHVEEELADVIIRVLDLAAALGLSMDIAVRNKMRANADRPHKHGKAL